MGLEPSEGLVVAAALEEVGQFAIERPGQTLLDLGDPFGSRLELLELPGGIGGAQGVVADDRQALAEGGGQFGERSRIHRTTCTIASVLHLPDGCGVVEIIERHILIVDDDTGVLRLLRESLASLVDGCHIDATPSPEYAFELALKRHYDLFVFDLVMPGMDGAMLYRLIRTVYESADPPIPPLPPMILLTGHGDHPRAQEVLTEPGVRGLLTKPFTLDRVLTKVARTLLSLPLRPELKP